MPYASNAELPQDVKANLPEEAQTLWRGAYTGFMGENPKAEEESAYRVAWAAVKKKFKKEGDQWVKIEEPVATHKDHQASGEQTMFSDMVSLDAVEKRPAGYMKAFARAARSGIQIYKGYEVNKPSLDEVRIYRPPEEVFNKDTVASMTHIPITLGHPPLMVDSKSWKEYAVGWTGDEIMRDGETVRVPMMVADQKAIDAYDAAKSQELSMGYLADIKWEPGVTKDGQHYDAVQTNIRYNHLAIVPLARGGEVLRIGDENGDRPMKQILIDGMTVSFADEVSGQIVQTQLAKMQKQMDEMGTMLEKEKKEGIKKDADIVAGQQELEKKQGENTVLKNQLDEMKVTPKKLNDMVRARARVIDTAAKILDVDPASMEPDDDDAIKKKVVANKLGSGTAEAMSKDAIAGAFDAIAATVAPAAKPGFQQLADAIRVQSSTGAVHNFTGEQLKDAAIDARNKRQADAWKGHRKTA